MAGLKRPPFLDEQAQQRAAIIGEFPDVDPAADPAAASTTAAPTATVAAAAATPGAAAFAASGGREAVAAMKVKEIKEELTQLGASTRGLLEKSEFVEALLAAREAAAEREANAEADSVFDADVSEGQTQKMPKVRAQSNPLALRSLTP